MTKFEALKRISGLKEFSTLIFSLAERAGSNEELEKELAEELTDAELQKLKSIALRGDYPISFDGMQK